MLLTKRFTVEEETTNYIERLSREVESSKAVIAFMLSTDMATDTSAFKTYKAEFEEAFAAYDIAKTELQNRFIPQELVDKDGAHISWNLDYATSVLTVTYTGTIVAKEFEAYSIKNAEGKIEY